MIPLYADILLVTVNQSCIFLNDVQYLLTLLVTLSVCKSVGTCLGDIICKNDLLMLTLLQTYMILSAKHKRLFYVCE